MQIAINLAKVRKGLTGENPSVGCLIVKNDKIISYKGTEKIANSIPNNKFILFDNIYHEPHNDIEKDVIYKEINDFINK